MSKANVHTNLDNETLTRAMERGGFEEYPERYHEDGIHTFINDEDTVDLDISIDSLSDDNFSDSEEVPKNSITKPISNTDETTNENEFTKEDLKKLKKMKKNKKGFTVEDVIARNFQELLLEEKEFIKTPEGKSKRVPKTWFKIATNSFSLGFSLTNSLVGAGMLSMAQTCYKMGIVGFTLWVLATIAYFFITWFFYNKAIYSIFPSTLFVLPCIDRMMLRN